MFNNNHDDDLEESFDVGIFCLCFWVRYSLKRTFIDTIDNPTRVIPIAQINRPNLPIAEINQR
jgi:hypothetical protein